MSKGTDKTEGGTHGQPWLWVHRVGVTPLFVSLLVLVYALAMSVPAVPTIWTVGITLGIALALWSISARRWGSSKKVADSQLYRYVQALLFTCTVAVIVIKVWGELTWDWVLWCSGAWIILTLLFGAFWWNDNSNLTRIKVEKDVARWPETAKMLGLTAVSRGQVRETETGGAVRFWWPAGKATKQQVKGAQDKLEQLVGAPAGSTKWIDIANDDGHVDGTQIEMVWNDRAPGSKRSIDFTEPTAGSVQDKILLGVAEDGTEVWMQIYDPEYGIQHMIAGGVTGSGKSGFYHLLLAELADCRDIVRWGMDFKGGMSFRPWGPMFDWLIVEEDDALPMFGALRAVLEARAKYAARRGWDPWQPDADHPLLCLFVDECAIPFSMGHYEVVELGKIIAQQGRAAGVMMCLATQHATNESVGSQQIMKNLNRRFAFRCADSSQQSVLLPNGYGEVDCTAIPAGKQHSGKCYWSDGGVVSKLLMRIRYVTKEMIKDLVEKYWEFRCDLDRGSARAARKGSVLKDGGNAYDERHIWTIDDVQLPDSELFSEGELLDFDRIWDEIFGDGPVPVDVVDREPEEFPTSMRKGGSGTSGPESGPADYQGVHNDDEEDLMPYDESKGAVAFTSEFLTPDTQEGRDELARAAEEFMAERTDRYTPTEAEARLHQALLAAGTRGIPFGELCTFVGRKKSWTNDKLLKLMREGERAQRDEHGVWRYSDAELAKHSVSSGDSR